ncbi:MAG: FAD-binding oxidoreductase, partial [Chloroflexi bacterium]|nr:FAD-binding oxidoreductase [Chloroflexota bacterium]
MKPGLVSDLEAILGAACVSTDVEKVERYTGDALGVYRAFRAASRLDAQPATVVFPQSTAHVSQLLKYASLHEVPVVPYGGGTGVMGAAAPIEECIVLSLRDLNKTLNVSETDRTATFQPGVVLEDAASALNEAGLVLGHDPWSRPVATVAGAISTNGVGYTAAKHGCMGDQVLGLEAVLATGEVVRTKGVPKHSFGPSLKSLFIGTEGTLGVITEATLRVFPRPEKKLITGVVFPDFESGFHAVSQLYAEGVRPLVVDYGVEMWDEGDRLNHSATLHIGFDGFEQAVDTQLSRTLNICSRFDGRKGDDGEARRFWKARHSSGERYRRDVVESGSPLTARRSRSAYRMDYLHVALPVSKVLEYRQRCQRVFSGNQVIVREWSLWGMPEYFSFMIAREDDEDEASAAILGEVVDQVLGMAQEMGGTM